MEIGKMEFISKTGWIEESAGRRKFHILIEEYLRNFEMKILSAGECIHAIPIHFINENHRIEAYYDFTGFIQIKEYLKRKELAHNYAAEDHTLITDLLQILYEIFECIKGMENYMIFPDRITIHPDAIFINTNNTRVAIAFYPNNEPEHTLNSRVIQLIHELCEWFHKEEAVLYLNKIEDFIVSKNPGLDGIICFIGELQREISYIYWNKKDLRGIDMREPIVVSDNQEKGITINYFKTKIAALHIILLSSLIIVFLSEKLETISFIGLIVIAAALDLLMLKKLHSSNTNQ